MTKIITFIALAVIIIVCLNLVPAVFAKAQSVTNTPVGIQALINQPTK